MVNKYKEPYDIYIGRGSLWGNPYTHLKTETKAEYKVDTREQSIEMFEKHLRERLVNEPYLRDELMKLKGKTLGCFCKPKSCHGDVISKLVEELSQ